MKHAIFFLLLNSVLFGHGFDASTFVKIDPGWAHIKQEAWYCCEETHLVKSYDVDEQTFSHQKVLAGGYSEVPFYLKLGFDACSTSHCISCSAIQEFYLPLTDEWLPAYKLHEGNFLLTEDDELIELTYFELVEEPLTVYAIAVENTHTYFVGRNSVLTHNMVLPLTLGFTIPFGTGIAGGTLGGFFGPISFAGGIAVGTLLGYVINSMRSERTQRYELHDFDEIHIKNLINQQNGDASSTSAKNRPKIQHTQCYPDPDDDKDDKKKNRDDARKDYRPLTNKEARKLAKELGYKEDKNPPFYTHDKPAFRNGNRWISPDRYGHRGGVWKLFYGRVRKATYNVDLTKIIGE